MLITGEPLSPSAALLAALFDRNPWPIFVYDAESYRFLAANDAALRGYGYTRDEFLTMTVLDIRPEAERERLAAWHGRRDPERGYRFAGGTWRHVRRDGSVCEVRVTTLPWLEYAGRPAVISMVHDLAEDDRPLSPLLAHREALQAARAVGNFGEVGTFTLDLREGTFSLGGFFERSCGRAELSPTEAPAEFERLWHPLEREERERLDRALAQRAPYETECPMLVEGDVRWYHTVVKPVPSGAPTAMVGIVFDVTARKQEDARLRKLAFTDAQTGLPNHASLADDSVQRAAASSLLLIRCAAPAAPASYDSDESRACRARALAAVLRKVTPPNAELIRYGEDTFAILVTRAPHQPRVPLALAKRVIAAFERPLAAGEDEFVATPAVGVGVCGGACDIAELTRRANAALREAARSDGRVALYSDELDSANERRASLECSLRHAIAERRVGVVYQPIVSLRSGRIVGAEALMRWDCPGIGPVSPTEFIPIAEEGGVIVRLGEWILREACAQSRRWQIDGLPPIRISVNVSARQVQQREFVRLVRSVCEATGLDRTLLELELTERVMMHRDSLAMRNLAAVRRLGVRVSVDDFGTGYSALSYLAALPLDTLKLDRSFIAATGADSFQRHVAATITDLAHRRGLAVVGEGVETPAELETVRALGCDEAQGHLLGQPVDGEALAALLRREPAAETAAGRRTSFG